jgi:hypothetical protein
MSHFRKHNIHKSDTEFIELYKTLYSNCRFQLVSLSIVGFFSFCLLEKYFLLFLFFFPHLAEGYKQQMYFS